MLFGLCYGKKIKMAEVDKLVADIIAHDMELDSSRVVLYNQNYTAPIDSNIYIIIATSQFTRTGLNNRFDPETNEEVKTITGSTSVNIEVTSKSREALERKEEVLLAIISTYSQQVQEKNNIRIFASGDILDLSEIEGASAVHRFRIPLVVQSIKTKRTDVTPITQYKDQEVSTI